MIHPLAGRTLDLWIVGWGKGISTVRNISFVRKWMDKDDEDTAHPKCLAYKHPNPNTVNGHDFFPIIHFGVFYFIQKIGHFSRSALRIRTIVNCL